MTLDYFDLAAHIAQNMVDYHEALMTMSRLTGVPVETIRARFSALVRSLPYSWRQVYADFKAGSGYVWRALRGDPQPTLDL